MEIYLPSNGKIAVNKVEMRQPKIMDIRKSQEYSDISEVRKTQFVKDLCKNPEQIDEITTYDRDYLFTIAVSSLNMNKISFKSTCSDKTCRHKTNDFIFIPDVEPVFLTDPVECQKTILGETYNFRLLRVKDEIKAIDYANIDDLTFEQRKEDALVCAALSWEVNDENINKVKNLDLSVYYAAQFFQICCPHGLNLQKTVTCAKCGKKTIVVMEVTGRMLNLNMAIIMDRFASLTGKLDYKSFLDMTLPEYNFLIESLNAKYETR